MTLRQCIEEFVTYGFVRLAKEVLFSTDIGQSLENTSLLYKFKCGYLEEPIHPNGMGALSHTPTGVG